MAGGWWGCRTGSGIPWENTKIKPSREQPASQGPCKYGQPMSAHNRIKQVENLVLTVFKDKMNSASFTFFFLAAYHRKSKPEWLNLKEFSGSQNWKGQRERPLSGMASCGHWNNHTRTQFSLSFCLALLSPMCCHWQVPTLWAQRGYKCTRSFILYDLYWAGRESLSFSLSQQSAPSSRSLLVQLGHMIVLVSIPVPKLCHTLIGLGWSGPTLGPGRGQSHPNHRNLDRRKSGSPKEIQMHSHPWQAAMDRNMEKNPKRSSLKVEDFLKAE